MTVEYLHYTEIDKLINSYQSKSTRTSEYNDHVLLFGTTIANNMNQYGNFVPVEVHVASYPHGTYESFRSLLSGETIAIMTPNTNRTVIVNQMAFNQILTTVMNRLNSETIVQVNAFGHFKTNQGKLEEHGYHIGQEFYVRCDTSLVLCVVKSILSKYDMGYTCKCEIKDIVFRELDSSSSFPSIGEVFVVSAYNVLGGYGV